jgi:hypothetical protein
MKIKAVMKEANEQHAKRDGYVADYWQLLNRCKPESPEEIQKLYPIFYKHNKDKIDSGRILVFIEWYAGEFGMAIDLDERIALSLDTKA